MSVSELLATAISAIALMISIATWLKTERDKTQSELRDFLLDGMQVADQILTRMLDLDMRQPNSPEDTTRLVHETGIMQTLERMKGLKYAAVRWRNYRFHAPLSILIFKCEEFHATMDVLIRPSKRVFADDNPIYTLGSIIRQDANDFLRLGQEELRRLS